MNGCDECEGKPCSTIYWSIKTSFPLRVQMCWYSCSWSFCEFAAQLLALITVTVCSPSHTSLLSVFTFSPAVETPLTVSLNTGGGSGGCFPPYICWFCSFLPLFLLQISSLFSPSVSHCVARRQTQGQSCWDTGWDVDRNTAANTNSFIT